jgi:hypothetical protein
VSAVPNQIILCYNPPIRTNWIPTTFYEVGKIIPDFAVPLHLEIKSFDRRSDKEIINRSISIRTNYTHNPHIDSNTAAIYECFKTTNPYLYTSAVLTEWGSNAKELYFSQHNYIVEELPVNNFTSGVIYRDPNLAKTGRVTLLR